MKRLAGNLTFQVLCAVALGALVGAADPPLARAMRPVGDTFVKLVKMVIGPIIFLTIVIGISNIADLKKVGRAGIVPASAVDAFAQRDILQIVFFSVLFGTALTALGERGR